MKPNNDKCHLIVCNQDKLSVTLGDERQPKVTCLARISKYLNQDKLKIIMKTFVQSQFDYCPLLWMFHNSTLNHKINKLHEKALRIVYREENYTREL